MSTQVNTADVSIKKLEIRSGNGRYNLLPHFLELNIYENLYSSSLTSNITLVDSINLPYYLDLVGQETIDIDITLPGFGDGKDSEVYSVKPPSMHVNS